MFYRCLNDKDWTIISISSQTEEITGYSEKEILFNNIISFANLVHPADQKWLYEERQKSIQEKKACNNQFRIILKGGHIKWVKEFLNATYNKDGSVNYLEGFMQEIPFEKNDAIFSNSVLAYQNAINKSSIVSITDYKGKIIYTNALFCYHSQYTAEELIGQNHSIINSNYHTKDFFEKLWKTINSGKIWRGEIRNKAKDGSYYWVDTVISPVLNDKGKIEQFLSIRNIITDEKEFEAALKESEELNKGILASLSSRIALIDSNGNILKINKAWEEFSKNKDGSNHNQSKIGLNYIDLLEKSPHTKNESDLKIIKGIKAILNREKNIFKLEYLDKKQDKWLILTVSAYGVENTKAVVRYVDINERKKAELQLKKVVNELTDRNNELMQFSYIVSHNLRSPIAQLIGLGNLLFIPNIDEEEKLKITDYIMTATHKLDDVIKDLNLVLSTRTSLNLKKQFISIKSVITSIIDTLESSILETDALIDINIDEEITEIFSVKYYIESIIYNLLSNAIKYRSHQRTPEITVVVKKENDKFIISITDNGIGIDLEKYKDQIFGLYKRFHLHIEGKGLGLHMTKTQVEALGGTISIESKVNEGTMFKVKIPEKEASLF
jgi:PAS domain S-box-containing protein